MSEDGAQQSHPESHFFCGINSDTSQTIESKTIIWYLDDENLADDYKIVLRDLKNILKPEKKVRPKLEH